MRFSAIVLLLSCWLLQPIHASLPEPAPPLKLMIDQDLPLMSIAHEGGTTALLFGKRQQEIWDADEQRDGGTLTILRDGDLSHHKISIGPWEELCPAPPAWRQIVCLSEKGTCLVAGESLRDLVFVPGEKAAADFPDLVPLVRQAWVIGEKNNYFLSFAWTNKARDRLLLLVCQQAFEDSMDRKDVLCYLAKGKQPWVIADQTVDCSPDVDLSARALFLKDGSGVFLSRDGKGLICFPAGQDAGYSLPRPGLCKGMSWQGDQDIRLLMQHKSSIFARPLTLTGESAAFGGDKNIAALPEEVSLATPLGEGYWVYPTDDRKLILWSEEEGVAAAPLISDMHMWQVADDGRILYCLAANESQSIIGAIDVPPAPLYQEAGELKKAAACFPVRGPGGTAGFYIAETQKKGTFYPSPTDGSFFSLENGKSASIRLPKGYAYGRPDKIRQATGWFCPEQKRLYLALLTYYDFELYELEGSSHSRPFHDIKWGNRYTKKRFSKCHSGKNMQWVVNEKTNSPVLVLLCCGGASHLQTLRGLPLEVQLSEETELPLFTFLGDCNLAASTTEDRIHVYRLSVTSDEEMEEKLAATPLFNCSRGLANPKVSMLLSIQERGIERVLLRTGGQMYCTNFLFKESGATCTPHTEKIEDGHFLFPPAFAAHYIGNRAIGHASDTGGRPCVIVADDKGELSLLHFVPTFLLVSGFLRSLGFRVEDLVPDMIYLLERSLGGALLGLQEQTLWRPALFTWSNYFVPFAFSSHIKKNQHVEVKCRALVRFQQ